MAMALTGCSGHSTAKHPPRTVASSPPASSAAAVRWWSNAAVTVGSAVDAADPEAAAASLLPSQSDYCGMLKQTLAAGKSIIPDSTAADPALLLTARAFVAEIEKVAPPAIAPQWQQAAPVVVSLVRSGGNIGALPSGDLGALIAAAQKIGTDSRARCGVDISALTGLLPNK